MLEMDIAILLIWYLVPLSILLGRGALEANRSRKRRRELRELEQRSTPMTREF
ncbi:MAG: hypothetical protein ACFFAY_13200 [Promethearchaeota archaeon]